MGASEVFINQSFKSQLFSSSQKEKYIPQIEINIIVVVFLLITLHQFSEKKYLKLKSWLNFNAIIVLY